MCEVRVMEVMSSGTSFDKENKEHIVGNLSLDVVGQGWPGMLIDGFSRGLGACAGSGKVSSGIGSLLSGDARCLVHRFSLNWHPLVCHPGSRIAYLGKSRPWHVLLWTDPDSPQF